MLAALPATPNTSTSIISYMHHWNKPPVHISLPAPLKRQILLFLTHFLQVFFLSLGILHLLFPLPRTWHDLHLSCHSRHTPASSSGKPHSSHSSPGQDPVLLPSLHASLSGLSPILSTCGTTARHTLPPHPQDLSLWVSQNLQGVQHPQLRAQHLALHKRVACTNHCCKSL